MQNDYAFRNSPEYSRLGKFWNVPPLFQYTHYTVIPGHTPILLQPRVATATEEIRNTINECLSPLTEIGHRYFSREAERVVDVDRLVVGTR